MVKSLVCIRCRSIKDEKAVDMGVAGTVEEIADCSLSLQPICSLDWCQDKAGLFCCGSLDQMVRIATVAPMGSALQ